MKVTQVSVFELDSPYYACQKHLYENFKHISDDVQMIVQKIHTDLKCNSGEVGCEKKVEYEFEEIDI